MHIFLTPIAYFYSNNLIEVFRLMGKHQPSQQLLLSTSSAASYPRQLPGSRWVRSWKRAAPIVHCWGADMEQAVHQNWMLIFIKSVCKGSVGPDSSLCICSQVRKQLCTLSLSTMRHPPTLTDPSQSIVYGISLHEKNNWPWQLLSEAFGLVCICYQNKGLLPHRLGEPYHLCLTGKPPAKVEKYFSKKPCLHCQEKETTA